MNDCEINLAIAAARGWKIEPTQAKGGWKLYCGATAASFWWKHDATPTLQDVASQLPDYCHDLNAMHDAEESLDCDQYTLFKANLSRLADRKFEDRHRAIVSATARQRAEAFLRTIGKWRET